MKELIDKAAVVSEIEELDEFWHLSKSPDGQAFIESLLSFLDNIEVKEVDLEKEYEEFVVDDPILGNFITNDTMGIVLAKHFFELGLKIKKC